MDRHYTQEQAKALHEALNEITAATDLPAVAQRSYMNGALEQVFHLLDPRPSRPHILWNDDGWNG